MFFELFLLEGLVGFLAPGVAVLGALGGGGLLGVKTVLAKIFPRAQEQKF